MQKIEAIFHDAEREIPALGRVVRQGETFEAPDDIAASLLDQEENYRTPAPPAQPAPPVSKPQPQPVQPADTKPAASPDGGES